MSERLEVRLVPPEPADPCMLCDPAEAVIHARKKNILAGIVDEIFRGYVTEPTTAAAALNIADALTRHANALRGGQ